MFNDAARKFYDKLEMGKVYYISRGTLKVANKQFKTVQNDYEMTLNENSEVKEASSEASFVPETKFNFVPIDMLGPHVNGKELIDVIGVVQGVSPTISIRRKSNDDIIPKRDITIADETKKTVVVSLWNDLATTVGQELLDSSDQSPIVAIKSLRVGDFQGVSLSTIKSMYSDRVFLSHFTSNPSLGEDKPASFSVRAYVSFIRSDQTMWYRACKTCKKKVTEAIGSGYWCEGCQKNDEGCSLRYIMVAKVSDPSGEAWLSAFNEEAEHIIGCPADELNQLRSQENEENPYQLMLKLVTWVPHLFRYMAEKRQRITVRGVAPVDFAAESRFLLEEISKEKASQ
ncbi:hypothetical protein EUGRSUZ_B00601 [Eucalyptus grandis]|uniref:Uncharacterized protein n=2 Tax=Eucalyptus grandis TaxID=71139 RepID=A0ACC3LMQ3_EUCGR|nr:hypothetical protein EUGRSUZ_B00601 [Eucalyptus grandis]